MNDCYHNLLWLGMAAGATGAPIPGFCPKQLAQYDASKALTYYDISGTSYVLTNADGTRLPYNAYTDEILDSMLSMSRFTSLIQWPFVSDTYHYAGANVTLQNASTHAELSPGEWKKAAASDGTMMVGWIVRNYGYRSEKDDATTPVAAPEVVITGLTYLPYELIWFDDHKGQIIQRTNFTGTGITTTAPNTEAGGFGKSIAFLIQPQGMTPERDFAALPNELIGFIDVPTTRSGDVWHEEWPKLTKGEEYTFTFETKQGTIGADWRYRWTIDDGASTTTQSRSIEQTMPSVGTGWLPVKVDVYADETYTNRVCGDVIHVQLHN